MSRIRTIKPEFFRHEKLFEAEQATGLPLRLAFEGLWIVADREGRFRWQPRIIKLDVLPFDNVDFAAILNALAEHGFVVRYTVGAETFGHIPSWAKHQHVNVREQISQLPAPPNSGEPPPRETANETPAPVPHVRAPALSSGEGELEREMEGKGSQRSPHASAAEKPESEEAPAANSIAIPVALLRGERDQAWIDQVEAESREAAGLVGDPSPGLADISPIVTLIAAGFDFTKDVVPALRAAKAANKRGRTWRYYVAGITEGKSRNGAIQPKAASASAKPMAWVLHESPQWEATRTAYRAAHGKDPPRIAGLGGMGWHFPPEMVLDIARNSAETH